MFLLRLFFLSLMMATSLTYAAPSEAGKLTTLRPVGEPQGTFTRRSGSTTYLTHVQVEIKNVGSVDAKDIRVIAILPDGRKDTLSGPNSLTPNKKALYSSSMNQPVTNTKKIEVKATCSNCRD